jgi:plasmid stabilization system protein ParE
MRRYLLSTLAKQDLREITTYFKTHSPSTGVDLLRALRARFDVLGKLPGMGHPRDAMVSGLRCSLVEKYVIYYRHAPWGIEIARVVHQLRDQAAIFGKK